MKTLLPALALGLATALPVWAEDAHHPDQAPAAAAAPAAAVQRMRDNAATMQSQLDALAAAKTPEERQKLLMQHMQTMRENMMLGQQMMAGEGGHMGCSMMGGMGAMHGGMMMGAGGAAASPEAMAARMHQMEKRMDMMQMMMERMGGATGKGAAK